MLCAAGAAFCAPTGIATESTEKSKVATVARFDMVEASKNTETFYTI